MKSSRFTRAELVPLSRAWARGVEEVVVLASTLPGKSREAIEKISALNGRVIRQIQEIDYLRIVLPFGPRAVPSKKALRPSANSYLHVLLVSKRDCSPEGQLPLPME